MSTFVGIALYLFKPYQAGMETSCSRMRRRLKQDARARAHSSHSAPTLPDPPIRSLDTSHDLI